MSESHHHPHVRIGRSNAEGFGLFATHDIKNGTFLAFTVGKVIISDEVAAHPKPLHCFQIEEHFQMAPFDHTKLSGIFTTNHSCSPNAGIRNATNLISIRDIKAGEEICYDYCMTDCSLEETATVMMDCLCGSPECRKVITDLDWKDKTLQARYAGYFSTYLEEFIHAQQS